MALVNRPCLLVLDEPTAGLDPKSRRELHGFIRQLKADGRSILLSTHYLEEAHELCDRIGILHEGKIVAHGTPDELIGRSRARPRLIFRTRVPVDSAFVDSLPCLVGQQQSQGSWTVTTSDINRTITGLIGKLEAGRNEMLDLQIQRPSLEEVFLELTSTAWTESP